MRKNPCPDFCVDRNQDCNSDFHACLSTAFRCELTTTAVSTCRGLCTMLIFLHVSYPVLVYMLMTSVVGNALQSNMLEYSNYFFV